MTYQAKVIAGGKMVIPAAWRRELNIKDGDSLVLERDEQGGIHVKTFEQVVREEQAAFRRAVGATYSVDQFLADRHVDWDDE